MTANKIRSILGCIFIIMIAGCKTGTLRINSIGEFHFRRSYAGIEFQDLSVQEFDSIKNLPSFGNIEISEAETSLLRGLLTARIIDSNYNLIRSKFADSVHKRFTLTKKSGERIQGNLLHPSGREPDLYQLAISFKKNKAVIELEGHYGYGNRDISYLLLDLIPAATPKL